MIELEHGMGMYPVEVLEKHGIKFGHCRVTARTIAGDRSESCYECAHANLPCNARGSCCVQTIVYAKHDVAAGFRVKEGLSKESLLRCSKCDNPCPLISKLAEML